MLRWSIKAHGPELPYPPRRNHQISSTKFGDYDATLYWLILYLLEWWLGVAGVRIVCGCW